MKNRVLKISVAAAVVIFIFCGLSSLCMPILLIPMTIAGLYLALFMEINKKEVDDLDTKEFATVEDCEDMYNIKGMKSIIEDGKLIGFEYEKSTDTDRQSEQC